MTYKVRVSSPSQTFKLVPAIVRGNSCYLSTKLSIMEGIMSLINETASSNEVTDVTQINQKTMQEFLQKMPIWDFFEIRKDEFTSKSETDR